MNRQSLIANLTGPEQVVVKVSKAWEDAPFELCIIEENGNLRYDAFPMRFKDEDLPKALEAFKRKDFHALNQLQVPEFTITND